MTSVRYRLKAFSCRNFGYRYCSSASKKVWTSSRWNMNRSSLSDSDKSFWMSVKIDWGQIEGRHFSKNSGKLITYFFCCQDHLLSPGGESSLPCACADKKKGAGEISWVRRKKRRNVIFIDTYCNKNKHKKQNLPVTSRWMITCQQATMSCYKWCVHPLSCFQHLSKLNLQHRSFAAIF